MEIDLKSWSMEAMLDELASEHVAVFSCIMCPG